MAFDVGRRSTTTRPRMRGDITYVLILEYSMMACELARHVCHFADLRDDKDAEPVRRRLIKEIEGLSAAAGALMSEITWRARTHAAPSVTPPEEPSGRSGPLRT